MKRVIIFLIVILSVHSSMAVPFQKPSSAREEGIATKKVENKRFSKKQEQNALGIWGLSSGNIASDDAIFIDIKQYDGNKKGGFITYDVIDSQGNIYDFNLVGNVSKGLVNFTVPYINGYSHIAMRVNKKGNSAKYIDTFIETNICEFTGSYTDDGFPIFVCIFPSAGVGSISDGQGVTGR